MATLSSILTLLQEFKKQDFIHAYAEASSSSTRFLVEYPPHREKVVISPVFSEEVIPLPPLRLEAESLEEAEVSTSSAIAPARDAFREYYHQSRLA